MAKKVFISATNCITPIGFDVKTNIENIVNGVSAIGRHSNRMMKSPYYAALIDDEKLNAAFAEISSGDGYSRLEKMMVLALHPIVNKAGLASRTAFILSTTKGNVSALRNPTDENIEKAQLSPMAKKIADFFGFQTAPIVVSNACVSGLLAISVAKRLIQGGMFDDAYVVAGDEVTEFVLSGFNSFQAMSTLPCKPYSKNRAGVSLGEASAAIFVTTDRSNAKVEIAGDGSINDANHISGPSRTGEGLFRSIESAMQEADLNARQIDYISAHGTATPFNDEMEAIAFNRVALEDVPVNSLKGFYGHTLGASGLLETIIGIESVLKGQLFESLGFDESGVSKAINVIEKTCDKKIQCFLKTASGFGGSNTAIIFKKPD